MTTLTELGRVVAIAAVRFACVRRARVTGEEGLRMVRGTAGAGGLRRARRLLSSTRGLPESIGLRRAGRAMAVEALRAHMAALAGRRARARLRSVSVDELASVARWRRSHEQRPGGAPWTSLRQRSDRARRLPHVARRAALLGVAVRARRHRTLRIAPMC